MRKELKQLDGNRQQFIGTLKKFGIKTGWKGKELKTILMVNIQDLTGKEVADHLWFNLTKGFEELDLQQGDKIIFHARVKTYWKGYKGYCDDEDLPPVEKDYKLSHPTKMKKLTNPLKEITGQWPGDETIEQILFILEGSNN